jgi:hypothetical protein
MRWGLRVQIVWPVILVAVLAIGLSALLNYGKFLRTLSALEGSRFTFIVSDIKGSIEGGLDLGVPLLALATAQDVIEREASKESQIDAIIVFDGNGNVLFRTGRNVSLTRVPQTWIVAMEKSREWFSALGADLVAGTRLTSDIGQTVGGVAVLYPRDLLDGTARRAAERLVFGAVIVSLVTGAAAFPVVSWLLARVRRDVHRLADATEGKPVEAAPLPKEARGASEAALAGIAAIAAESGLGDRQKELVS